MTRLITDDVGDNIPRHQLNIITEEILKPHDVTNPLHASKTLWQSNISREKLLTTIDRMIDKESRCALPFCCAVLAEHEAHVTCGDRLGLGSVGLGCWAVGVGPCRGFFDWLPARQTCAEMCCWLGRV